MWIPSKVRDNKKMIWPRPDNQCTLRMKYALKTWSRRRSMVDIITLSWSGTCKHSSLHDRISPFPTVTLRCEDGRIGRPKWFAHYVYIKLYMEPLSIRTTTSLPKIWPIIFSVKGMRKPLRAWNKMQSVGFGTSMRSGGFGSVMTSGGLFLMSSTSTESSSWGSMRQRNYRLHL